MSFDKLKSMQRYCALAVSLFIGIFSFSQTEIKLEDVSKHLGDSVKVCGLVAGIRYMEQANNKPTLINLGAAYPNQLLTVVIWDDVRKQFEKVPEELFQNKTICVIGKIELFRERPQIVVKDAVQIEIK
jgi:hypothetical protein